MKAEKLNDPLLLSVLPEKGVKHFLSGFLVLFLLPSLAVAEPVPASSFRDCPDCPEMQVIPAGRFLMGLPETAPARDGDESPQHPVTILRFALGKYEVTRGQFAAFVRATGHETGENCRVWNGKTWERQRGRSWRHPGYPQQDDHPVVCVSRHDALAYVRWLGQQTGLPYRLASEAEWEYAARAGTTTAAFWGDDPARACAAANGMDQTGKAQVPNVDWASLACQDGYAYTAPAGRFLPNAFGLHDMLGNVSEWVQDCYHDNYQQAPADGRPLEDAQCFRWVTRGGGWESYPRALEATNRNGILPTAQDDALGFRVARSLPGL